MSSDRSFLLRRLHSLSGIFPVGAFLLEHLLTNFYATRGPDAYNDKVKFLAELPVVVALELFFIWIPILYHGGYGVYIWWRGETNVGDYPLQGNWLYSLQRWTGLVAFAYICYHVWEQRFAGAHILDHTFIAFSKVQHSIAHPAVHAFYVVGLLAACFHFSYGVWLFACKWGLTPGLQAQRKLFWACMGLFAILTGAGLASLRAFKTHPLQPTPEQIIQMRR
jgi:succinate dehydrogenase / fumarate reductase cytochrome b subunit